MFHFFVQPSFCDDNWNNIYNDENKEESPTSVEIFHPNTPVLDRASKKNKSFQYHPTNDTVPNQHRRTPLRHLQAMLWPKRDTHPTTSIKNQSKEQEQIPMVNKSTNNDSTTNVKPS